jgi:hypothetical protein
LKSDARIVRCRSGTIAPLARTVAEGRTEKRRPPTRTWTDRMDIHIRASFLPHDKPDRALAFDRDALGLEMRNRRG